LEKDEEWASTTSKKLESIGGDLERLQSKVNEALDKLESNPKIYEKLDEAEIIMKKKQEELESSFKQFEERGLVKHNHLS